MADNHAYTHIQPRLEYPARFQKTAVSLRFGRENVTGVWERICLSLELQISRRESFCLYFNVIFLQKLFLTDIYFFIKFFFQLYPITN